MGNYKIFFFFFVLAIFLFLPKKVFAQNLLQNPGFENISNSLPTSWEMYPGTATMSAVSTPVKSGEYALSINKTNDATGTIYAYQDVDIDGGRTYKLSGYVQKNDANFAWVVLRINWRRDGESIESVDSPRLEENTNEYKIATLDSALAPDEATIARVEAVANINIPNPVTPVFFDELILEEVQPTPTSEPEDTPEPTDTPTSTPIPTPTPTKKPTPTLKPSPTSTPAGEILGEEESATSAFYPLEATGEAETSQESTSSFKIRWLPKIFLGAGFLLLFGAALWVWYTQLRTKI